MEIDPTLATVRAASAGKSADLSFDEIELDPVIHAQARLRIMAALSSLGDTHKLGYEGLTMSMQRLEQRVKQLEERR